MVHHGVVIAQHRIARPRPPMVAWGCPGEWIQPPSGPRGNNPVRRSRGSACGRRRAGPRCTHPPHVAAITTHEDVRGAPDDPARRVAEDATGFYFENGKWIRAKFDVSEDKFLIRKLRDEERRVSESADTYGVFELGSNSPSRRCEINEMVGNEHENYIMCTVGAGRLYFSVDSGRYLLSYMFGYWEGEDTALWKR